jgi:lipoprotein Spr
LLFTIGNQPHTAAFQTNMTLKLTGLFLLLLACSCNRPDKPVINQPETKLTGYTAEHITDIKTGNTTPFEVVNFACSLTGTPYKYGSTDPTKGFDCSGFVTYVFNHFGIMVPRASVDFTPVLHPIELKDAKLGDILLFTGTDSTVRVVGHIGIVSTMPGEPLKFLHSTSGRGYGVVETAFNTRFYTSRYVKTIRVFPQNDY